MVNHNQNHGAMNDLWVTISYHIHELFKVVIRRNGGDPFKMVVRNEEENTNGGVVSWWYL